MDTPDTPDTPTASDMGAEPNRDGVVADNGRLSTSPTTARAIERRWRNGADADAGQLLAAQAGASVEGLGREDPEAVVERMFAGYLDEVKQLGVVDRVAVGTEPGRRVAYLWNVLVEDISSGGTDFTLHYRLNRLGYALKCELSDIVRLDIAHVNPSQLAELQEQCREQRIELDFVPV